MRRRNCAAAWRRGGACLSALRAPKPSSFKTLANARRHVTRRKALELVRRRAAACACLPHCSRAATSPRRLCRRPRRVARCKGPVKRWIKSTVTSTAITAIFFKNVTQRYLLLLFKQKDCSGRESTPRPLRDARACSGRNRFEEGIVMISAPQCYVLPLNYPNTREGASTT